VTRLKHEAIAWYSQVDGKYVCLVCGRDVTVSSGSSGRNRNRHDWLASLHSIPGTVDAALLWLALEPAGRYSNWRQKKKKGRRTK
jgi:hypothetical protein